jgi:hypothetical protein
VITASGPAGPGDATAAKNGTPTMKAIAGHAAGNSTAGRSLSPKSFLNSRPNVGVRFDG